MPSSLTRRDFMKLSAVLSAGAMSLGTAESSDPPKKRWFKGNLHQHCQWSDGQPLPETAIAWYKERGYNFICPSDHNIFQNSNLQFSGFGFQCPPVQDKAGFERAFSNETSLWKVLSDQPGWARLVQKSVDEAVQLFGPDSIQSKVFEGKRFIRMKPFDELAAQFSEPERFLLIPGYEQTLCGSKWDVHVNFLNVRETFPLAEKETPLETLRDMFRTGADLFAGRDYLFTANHPLWRYYDWQPSDLIALPEIRIFELTNNAIDDSRPYLPAPGGWNPEKFWDAVNAWRASHDQELLFADGTDDRHDYSGKSNGWTVVRASSLSITDLFAAIRAGDFYTSNGLDFADIQFDGKTLSVKIDPKEESKYKILFIGTKKDYDPACKIIQTVDCSESKERKIESYSDKIGTVLEEAEGTEGSYTLKPDDLYVRAKIICTETFSKGCIDSPAAWTQPYRG